MAVRGTTAHFIVSFEDSLGSDGAALADAVLATCEADYTRLKGYFGEIDPTFLPLQVAVVAGMSGVNHPTCSSAGISIDGFSNSDGSLASILAAEGMAEAFMAAQGKGFDCKASNGEALARVLAADAYPHFNFSRFATASSWLNSTRPDFVNSND